MTAVMGIWLLWECLFCDRQQGLNIAFPFLCIFRWQRVFFLLQPGSGSSEPPLARNCIWGERRSWEHQWEGQAAYPRSESWTLQWEGFFSLLLCCLCMVDHLALSISYRKRSCRFLLFSAESFCCRILLLGYSSTPCTHPHTCVSWHGGRASADHSPLLEQGYPTQLHCQVLLCPQQTQEWSFQSALDAIQV